MKLDVLMMLAIRGDCDEGDTLAGLDGAEKLEMGVYGVTLVDAGVGLISWHLPGVGCEITPWLVCEGIAEEEG